ncbi:MAG: phosphoribosylanthranilate isomerase [Candidatus Walczuchella monophlebidarum]
MFKIKVCGLKYPSNLMEIFIMKPDFLGFIFYPFSPRFIKKDFPIPNFCEVKKIGVFVNSDEKDVFQKIENYRLDLIQLHGNEDVKFCYSLYDKKNIKIIKAFNVDKNFSFDQIKKYRNCVDYFLFDTKTSKYGGSGNKFLWNKLDEYYFDLPFFLSGGITINDPDEILKLSQTKLFCLDLNSNFEITPGFKNRNLISNFIKKIR